MPFLCYILVLLGVCYREVQVIGLETSFLWFLIMHLDTLLASLYAVCITEIDFLVVHFCYRVFLGLSDMYIPKCRLQAAFYTL